MHVVRVSYSGTNFLLTSQKASNLLTTCFKGKIGEKEKQAKIKRVSREMCSFVRVRALDIEQIH